MKTIAEIEEEVQDLRMKKIEAAIKDGVLHKTNLTTLSQLYFTNDIIDELRADGYSVDELSNGDYVIGWQL